MTAATAGPRPRPGPARAALLAWALATAAGVGVALTPDPTPPFVPPPGATSDLDFYGRVVRDVRAGVPYYEAAHRRLRAHGYPTRAVFNWRLPTYAVAFGSLPDGAARALLAVGMAATVLLWTRILLEEEGLWPATLGGLALVGATAWCAGTDTYLFTELWAGMFIALSLALARLGRPAGSVAAGLSALAFRELALPFVVLAGLDAARAGRRREAAAWGLGVFAFGAGMALHAAAVLGRLTPADLPMDGGWVRFGGIRFLLAAGRTNVALMGLPLAATAVVLPAAMVGLASDAARPGGRLAAATFAAYLGAFAVVGAPFNYYWGFVFAPLVAIGLARAPRAFARLASAGAVGLPAPGSCGKLSAGPGSRDDPNGPASAVPPPEPRRERRPIRDGLPELPA